MMFIRYQKVRNSIVGFFTAIGVSIAAFFGYQAANPPKPEVDRSAVAQQDDSHGANGEWKVTSSPDASSIEDSKTDRTNTIAVTNKPASSNGKSQVGSDESDAAIKRAYVNAMSLANGEADPSGTAKDVLGKSSAWKLNLYDDNKDGTYDRAKLDTNRDEIDDEKWTYKNSHWEKDDGKQIWKDDAWHSRTAIAEANNRSDDPSAAWFRSSMEYANAKADPSGVGKDVLGESSPWKLNLYDDEKDGVWDRAKLDTNRDEVDDEKWTFKNGHWEKNDGQQVWLNQKWVSLAELESFAALSENPNAIRYRNAFIFASSNADRTGVGKDVLGKASPWKLNLYDDDKNGSWDRAKLDTNRDEVDDEKWTFKNGRWEKNDGQVVWQKDKWVTTASLAIATANSGNPKLVRYRNAMKIANARADSSGKGKDVLGSASPWKLNLYDDDKDGTWDRAKLDTNRDDIDDEKWTFKNQRWEKDDGQMIWSNNKWASSAAMAAVTKAASDPNAIRYRNAMKIATARARSAKGKDVLGSASPWKLNLYDDDRDGRWDRGKLDTNRDEVDDEKWNFKKGRWEKDNGAKIWDGENWVGGK